MFIYLERFINCCSVLGTSYILGILALNQVDRLLFSRTQGKCINLHCNYAPWQNHTFFFCVCVCGREKQVKSENQRSFWKKKRKGTRRPKNKRGLVVIMWEVERNKLSPVKVFFCRGSLCLEQESRYDSLGGERDQMTIQVPLTTSKSLGFN